MTDDERRYHMQLVHTLAHYIHEGGGYEWGVRSHLAVEELDPGQEMHVIHEGRRTLRSGETQVIVSVASCGAGVHPGARPLFTSEPPRLSRGGC